jgi:hypothetical protein
MKGDNARAKSSLNELEATIRALPPNYYNNWVYPGTLVLIDRSELEPAMKQALRNLCKEGQWYTQQRAAEVIRRIEPRLRRSRQTGRKLGHANTPLDPAAGSRLATPARDPCADACRRRAWRRSASLRLDPPHSRQASRTAHQSFGAR